MKQFIIAVCIIGSVLAGPPPPECLKGPPQGKSAHECCKVPDAIPSSVFEKCMASNPPPPPPTPGSPPRGCCMSECVMNETGILTGGKLDKTKALAYIKLQLTDDADFKAATAAVDFCEKEANNKKADFDDLAKFPGAPGEKTCNMVSGFMIGCFNGQIYKNCPSGKYVADPACDAIKTFVDTCGFLFPNPGKM